MYALVDCNNFYVSCERLFQPHLMHKPVVVLSNNDGCVIARSEEAKAIGIVMGTPAYMCEQQFKEHDVKVFSSNYTLYGDLSDRVMKTLKDFVPNLELYSIDEAFLDMSGFGYTDLEELGRKIKKAVTKNIGIPVSVGIAATKTLAKMANRYAKKRVQEIGVFDATKADHCRDMLAFTKVEDIWGIGSRYALLMRQNGFITARDVTQIPPDWMRSNLSVVGLRLWNELNGVACIEWEYELKKKQNICTSRSFHSLTGDYSVVKEAVSNFAAVCALKLRNEKSICKQVRVFVKTNEHRPDLRQYQCGITLDCETPTSLTKEIIGYALKGLDIIWEKDCLFMKCGVEVLNLVSQNIVQLSLFDTVNRAKDKKLSAVMDDVNNDMGRDTIRMAVQRFDRRYRLRAAKLSKKYTTDINEILKIKI